MKTKLLFITLPVCLLCSCATTYSDEPKLHRPPGMPENELIAFDDYQKSVNSDDLADALGIVHFNFQVQVPDGTPFLRVALHLIEDGKDRDLGSVKLLTEKRDDSGNVIKGAKQFRVLVMVSPLDTSTADPLRESPKLRVFAKEFLTGNGGAAVSIENPFKKKHTGGVVIHNTTSLVRERKVPPGTWDGFETRFDLFSTDANKCVMRISFETADHLERTK